MRWQEVYEKAYKWAKERIKKSSGIALGFHSVVDGLVNVKEDEFEKIADLKNYIQDQPPVSIKTPEDFLRGFAYSFSKGKALQIMIESEDVYNWIKENFGFGEIRLGGTSANMAVALSRFGFKDVLIYIYPLSKDLVELFPEGENLKTIDSNGNIVHPKHAWNEEGIKAVHWIFEFKKGQRISGVECPRDNRFIASWNPVNSKLKISKSFKKHFPEYIDRYRKFIIAGFHIMREVYPDGETVEERFDELVSFVKEIKEKGISIHAEMASIRYPRVRRNIVEKIFPLIDSSGMNEVELSWMAKDMGFYSEELERSDPVKVYEFLKFLLKETGIKRIHYHTLGYYMVVSNDGDKEKELMKLSTAALAAAYRAKFAVSPNIDDLASVMKIPISGIGKKAAETLKHTDAIVLPTKVVEKPELTVGLGDTISSIAFCL